MSCNKFPMITVRRGNKDVFRSTQSLDQKVKAMCKKRLEKMGVTALDPVKAYSRRIAK